MVINTNMDPYVLLSVVNTKLRNSQKNLEDLCEEINIDIKKLKQVLHEIGYDYNKRNNQFNSK